MRHDKNAHNLTKIAAAFQFGWAVTVPFPTFAQSNESDLTLPMVTVIAPEAGDSPNVTLKENDLRQRRAMTSDVASLLQDVPGVSIYGAGGVSSLPVIHGLADDRNRIKLDGMDLIASCPNHMNPVLSYVDPSNVGALKVYTGITPVSVGGDSIGGAIVAETLSPIFSESGQGNLTKGEIGTFFRSNGNARGGNLATTLATEYFNISYSAATTQADNYKAGGNYKNFVRAGVAPYVAPDEVGSTAYKTSNHALGVAFKKDNHIFEAKFGYQDMPYQLYPNQRMDMLGNQAKRLNLRYLGQFRWGSLEARAYHEKVDHFMDFGPDKVYRYGILKPPSNTTGATYPVNGMPMYTAGKTDGVSVKADIDLTARDLLRIGAEMQRYRLDDWWPPAPDCGVGNCIGGMAPLTFWNINDGKRDRGGIFGEWEAKWTPQWLSLLGVRVERVHTDTGPVVGYNTSTTPLNTGMMKNMYETSAVGTRADFNAMDRNRTDHNVDLSAIARYTPDDNRTFEFGFSQKTRSPNLYERYSWSRNVMALEMNNFVGDGNGYLGNPSLKPEVAHTLSLTGAWRSTDRETEIKVTPYFTHVDNFIDAVQWNQGNNVAANPATPKQFVILKYMNQTARISGIDFSGRVPIGSTGVGAFGFKGFINYTKGENTDTGSGLYNIMPLNTKLTLTHNLGGWSNAIEFVAVKRKSDISVMRNEIKTPGYSLTNLRGSYSWKKVRLDFGVENIFDRLYYLPLGGAYTGEGSTMSFNKEVGNVVTSGGTMGSASMWGTAVPGLGRSIYAGVTVAF